MIPMLPDPYSEGNYIRNQDTGEATFFTSQPDQWSRPASMQVTPGRRLEDPMGIMGLGRTGQLEDPFGMMPGIDRARDAARTTQALNMAEFLSQFLPTDRVRAETLRLTGVDPGKVETPTMRKIQQERTQQENILSEITDRRIRAEETRRDIEKKDREMRIGASEAVNQFTSASQNLDSLAEEAGKILNNPDLWRITGKTGWFPDIPGSGAANLRAKTVTLQSKTAFNTLQALRDASKTGGALGNVSNFEIELLKNSMAALQTSQSADEYRKSLQQIIDYTDRAKARLGNALQSSYGDVIKKNPDMMGTNTPRYKEGDTATGPGGAKLIFRSGSWRPM